MRARHDTAGMDHDIVSTRRKRLKQVIEDRFDGRLVDFIARTGINAGELYGLLRQKSFGEKKARALERQAGLSTGYLDGKDGPDILDPDRRELWGKVLWLWNHADPEIMMMFTMLVGAMYHKKAQELLINHDAQQGAGNTGGNNNVGAMQEPTERGRSKTGE